jgi:hypothetical protein
MPERTDEDRLELLLKHWIEHNGEHAHEFMAWAERSGRLGRQEVSEAIVRAAEQVRKANECLADALGALKER